jgi:hypothetical protein
MSVSLAYLTREPAVNRRYQITANRLCLHATTTEQALTTLAEVHPHWPQSHPVFFIDDATCSHLPVAQLAVARNDISRDPAAGLDIAHHRVASG